MTQRRPGFAGRLAVVVAAGAVALATLVGLAYDGGALHFGAAYRLQAVLPTVSSLVPGADVTMAGVPVGRVASVRRLGDGALVGLEIDDARVTPVPADSRIALRETTPIGENSVEIVAGRSRAVWRSRAVVPISQAQPYVDVDQLLSVLQGSTGARTRQLVEGLGGALAGRGPALSATLGGVSSTVQPLAGVVQTLSADRARVGRLVLTLGDLAAAAGERGAAIGRLAGGALRSFRALAAEDRSLRATLAALPSTLRQVRLTSGTLGSVSGVATTVLAGLAVALRELRPGIAALAPAAATGRAVVRGLGRAAPGLTGTLRRVQGLAAPATSALPAVRRLLCQADPILRYAQPYTADVLSFVTSFGSAVNAYDDIGHVVRLVPILGENSLAGLPPALSADAYTLMHAGLLGDSTALAWNPYPKPGQIGTERAGTGPSVLGPAQLRAKTGFVYPHVLAAC